jgi:tellurite resistance protein TerC
VSYDPFIVFTSNVFAVLGMRSLYFVLATLARRFDYLQPGLAIILLFVGAKLALSNWFHVPVVVSLFVVATLLGGSILASMIKTRRERRRAA